MQNFPASRVLPAVLLGVAASLTACDAPDGAYVPVAPELTESAQAQLLSCPAVTGRATSGVVLPLLGGVLGLGATSVTVPAAAISGLTSIELEVPPSPYMLVELRANGQEHWQFLAPLTVTIDYSRCAVDPLDPPLTVWHVDPETGAMLEPMGGVDNRLLRTVTFVTDHFSGYAIAN
jgi:hypothetical protein